MSAPVLFSALPPRWRKVLRDLGADRARTALAVGAIAVGVFAVGVIASTRLRIRAEVNGGWAATQPADATLHTAGFDQELVAMAERVPGVRAAEGRAGRWLRFSYREPEATAEMVAEGGGGSGVRSGLAGLGARAAAASEVKPETEDPTPPAEWRDIRVVAIADFDRMRLSRLSRDSGAWPPDKGEVLLDRGALDYVGLEVGEALEVEAAGGRMRSLRIVGIVHDRARASAVLEQSAAGYVSAETMEWLGYGRRFNELHLAVEGAPDREGVESIAEAVRERIERGGRRVSWTWVPEPGVHPMDDTISPVFLILTVLGALATLLSALLVVNTIQALLARQVRQIGVMKAIGARSAQVGRLYMGTVLLFGLLSLAVAVPLGVVGAQAFSAWMAGLLNVDAPAWGLPWPVLGAQAAVALLAPLVAALWPVTLGARVPVRRALSEHGHGDRSVGGGRLDGLLGRAPLLGRPQRLALRNAFRRRGRMALALITLALAGAIVTSVFTVRSSLLNTLDGMLAYWGHDVRVGLRQNARAEMLVREALAMPGVELAEAWAFHGSRRIRPDGEESGNVLIVGPARESALITPRLRAGRWLDPADERGVVINGDFVSEEPDTLRVGDELVLRVQGRDVAFRIVGILEKTRSGPRAYLNYDALGRLTGGVGRAGSVRVVTSRHDAAFQRRIGEALEQRFTALGLGVDDVDLMANVRESTVLQFDILIQILLVMAALLSVVGAMGLTSLMSMNVLERTREIGVLRSLGAGHRDVLGLVLLEGLVVGALSGLLGLLAAVPLGRAFSAAIGVAFLEGPLDHRFSWGGALLWLGASLVVAAAASLWPAWGAMRVSVREALHYE